MDKENWLLGISFFPHQGINLAGTWLVGIKIKTYDH